MREIKFRAWHKSPIGDMAGIIRPVRKMELINGGWVVTLEKNVVTNIYELMEFTGLLDKNGKPIYEGDRITWRCQGSIIEGDVYWSSDGWWVKDNRGGNTTRLGKASTIEVIGDVYTTPELLKGEL